MSIFAIIPARGGSKRIPNKNIKSFAGQPIISYSINAAQETNLFEMIVVSTDSEKIARVAKASGAAVPFIRPAQLADDFTATDGVIVHAIEWLAENGQKPDYLCCIYPTAPFISADYLKRGLQILKREKAISAFTVTSYPFPIFRSLEVTDRGRLAMIWPEHLNTRSQDLPEAYHDAGQFYWAETNRYMREKSFYSSDAVPIFLPRYMVHDIDTEEDWIRAELVYEALRLRKGDNA